MLLDDFKETVDASLKLVKVFLKNDDLVTFKISLVALALHDSDIKLTLAVFFEIQKVGSVLVCARYLDREYFAT